MRTLILGVGNTLFCDDGIGIYVARELKIVLKNNQDISVEEASVGGITLMELLVGYNKAIIIDAIHLKQYDPGYIHRLSMDSLVSTRHSDSPHDTNFITALDIGNKLNLALPCDITIFAIEIGNITSLKEECTPKVKEAIPRCVEMVLRELKVNKAGMTE
jgi:hydrogenase maturation protease